VLVEFGYRDAARVRELHASYVDAGGPARVDARSDFSMVVAQLGHILELACRRWLEPDATDADHALNEGRVDEFRTKPVTLEVIDGILDARTT
jgi:hypothetical protein